MDVFQGVPINEYRLLIYYSVVPFLLIAELVGMAFHLHGLFGGKDRKAARNLKSLEQRAETDAVALARLEKLKRKNQRKRKHNRNERLPEIGLLVLLVGLIIWTLYGGIIQPATDYVRKDYVVYTGEIRVYERLSDSRIEIEDGTVVWGRGGLTEEDTYGTVVYAKRSKQVLGGKR